MSSRPLTKSYVDTRNPKKPDKDITLYQIWDEARENGFVGSILNLETGEKMTNLEILDLADNFAKGLLALGLKPGESSISVIGCPSLYSGVGMFVAACSIGVQFAHPYMFEPYHESIKATANMVDCSVVVVGEGNNGRPFDGIVSLIDESSEFGNIKSDRVPTVKHVFYDQSYRNRSPKQNYIKNLDHLIELGKSVTNEELALAKSKVHPEDIMLHFFSSGSTGEPKCIAHTYKGLANNIMRLTAKNLPCTLGTNVNGDELVGVSVVSFILGGYFKNSVMAPDLGTNRSADEFGKLCYDSLISEKVKILGVIPGMQSTIIKYAEDNKLKFPHIDYALAGGQIISRGFKEKLVRVLKGRIWTVYGMSEIGCSAWTSVKPGPEGEESSLNSILYPAKNSETRIADMNDEVVDIGVDGEVQYKSSSVLKTYRKKEDLYNKLMTSDGYARTGDIGMMLPDGGFVVKGRVVDALRFKVFAKVIYPGPIEEALGGHPNIQDISVISGHRNDWMGDEVTYCITLMAGAEKFTESDLNDYCVSHGLTDQYFPCRIIYFDEFPRTPNSRKVSKKRLREDVGEMIKQDPVVGMTEVFKTRAEKMGVKLGAL